MGREPAVPLTDQFRAAVDASGRSRGSLCRETGIDPGLMSKFMGGAKGLSTASLDALAGALGVNLTDRPTKFSRPASKRKDS